MLTLTYSNRTEDLLRVLTESLREEREQHGLWEPIQLVVPNPSVKRYLLDQLGRSLGVLAHVRVNYLDGLWRRPLRDLPRPVQIWNRHALQGAALSVLTAPGTLQAPEFQPLQAYLGGDGSDLKLLQLTEKAAGLLETYTLTRPGWLGAWAQGRDASGGPSGLEAWQRNLWRRIQAAAQASPARWATLAELLADGTFDTLPLPPRIHIFGLSYAAEVYHRAFEAAARRVDVRFYALNPCQEYWDDLPSEREARRLALRLPAPPEGTEDPYGLTEDGDSLLLRRWGRAGRENIRLLNEISGCDFESAFPDTPPAAPTLLARLQEGFRFRKPPEPGPADGSLKILACPDAAREAEVVASEIWLLMEQARLRDPERPLRFSDIAVVVPSASGQRSTYIDHLRTAFDATGRIPLVVVDAPPPALSQLLDGAEQLLDLPAGRCSRRDLLRALTHPAVLARFPEAESRAWASWVEAAGIIRGLDEGDLHEESLRTPGTFHWQQGLERLAASAFLPPDEPWQTPGREVIPAEAGDTAPTAAFIARASDLLRRIRQMRGQTADLSEWAATLADYLLDHLGGEDAADVQARAALAEALQGLADLVPQGLPQARLSYRQARGLARRALERLRGEAGGRPPQGVVVGGYAPMRALPFRAVFLMGLSEGQFPSPEEKDPLDLRRFHPKPGDVGASDRDRYLFLELVLGAREALRLTYASEDLVSGEARLPSSLVQDLVQALAPLTLADLQETHPRYRFDATYFPEEGEPQLRSLAPAAAQEAVARRVGPAVRAVLPDASGRPGTQSDLPQDLQAAVTPLLPAFSVLLKPHDPQAAPIVLRLDHLLAWLKCPVQGSAKARLHLRNEEEDPADLEEETLATDPLTRALLQREAFLRAAREGVDAETAYNEARWRRLQEGKAAPGCLGDQETAEDLALIQRQLRALQGETIRRVRFGPALHGRDAADDAFPPLVLHLPPSPSGSEGLRTVHLVGSLLPLTPSGSLLMATKAGVAPKGGVKETFRLKALQAHVDHHVLAAQADAPLAHGILQVAGANEGGKAPGAYRTRLRFAALEPQAARAQLTAWAAELLDTRAPALLPLEAVLKGEHGSPEALQAWIQEALEDPKNFAAFKSGPLLQPERYPVDPTPQATAERRLGEFIRQTESAEPPEVVG